MKNILILASLSLALGTPGLAQPQARPWTEASIVQDPAWQERFLGSYGFLSGAEPEVRDSELELLREVIGVMKASPRAAATMLGEQIGESSSAALDFVLANLYFQTGQLDPAMASYSAALKKFPDFRRAHKNLGLLRVQKGDYKGALNNLTRAVELGDRDGRSYGLIGYCYVNLENYFAAEEAYRNAILAQPDTRDWKLGLARALLAMNKHTEAAALFASLIAADPQDANAWMLQANAYLGLERPLDAAVNLETVRLLGKAQPSSLELLGNIYMNANMPELAKDAYLEVVRGDGAGTRYRTAYNAASLLVRTGAHDAAREMLASIDERYVSKLAPDDELELLTLKAKLARAQGRKREAARLLRSIVERDGTRGDALLELAAHHRAEGDRERALLLIERAARLEAYEYPALLEHAQYMVSERDYPRAAELLRAALQIRSEPRVEQFLDRVEGAIRQ